MHFQLLSGNAFLIAQALFQRPLGRNDVTKYACALVLSVSRCYSVRSGEGRQLFHGVHWQKRWSPGHHNRQRVCWGMFLPMLNPNGFFCSAFSSAAIILPPKCRFFFKARAQPVEHWQSADKCCLEEPLSLQGFPPAYLLLTWGDAVPLRSSSEVAVLDSLNFGSPAIQLETRISLVVASPNAPNCFWLSFEPFDPLRVRT